MLKKGGLRNRGDLLRLWNGAKALGCQGTVVHVGCKLDDRMSNLHLRPWRTDEAGSCHSETVSDPVVEPSKSLRPTGAQPSSLLPDW